MKLTMHSEGCFQAMLRSAGKPRHDRANHRPHQASSNRYKDRHRDRSPSGRKPPEWYMRGWPSQTEPNVRISFKFSELTLAAQAGPDLQSSLPPSAPFIWPCPRSLPTSRPSVIYSLPRQDQMLGGPPTHAWMQAAEGTLYRQTIL